jgi:hypothetical protein
MLISKLKNCKNINKISMEIIIEYLFYKDLFLKNLSTILFIIIFLFGLELPFISKKYISI